MEENQKTSLELLKLKDKEHFIKFALERFLIKTYTHPLMSKEELMDEAQQILGLLTSEQEVELFNILYYEIKKQYRIMKIKTFLIFAFCMIFIVYAVFL
jgi:hypothetical protein